MKKYNNIIAIDPDVEKSGVAYLKTETRQLEVSSLTFPKLLDYLQYAKTMQDENKESLIIVVEAGWLVQSNWHLKNSDNKRIAGAKGNAAGRNHETGRKIVEMCKYYGIEVLEHFPLRKCWKGKDGKITHEELSSFTGLTGKTNQDARDAALLAWCFAGLPIRLRCL
ncbi:hypothetical protein EZS27_014437 [termite gut metagenome]|uniref:Uncharacterized protein n=1 Tax=termite gut metagenome TaxID=433724 RepID=A0A5J4RU00_9ZZZZ